MKRIASLILAAVLAAGLAAFPASASTVTRSIPSVRIIISTTDMDFTSAWDDSPLSYVNIPDQNAYYTLNDAVWVDDVSDIRPGSSPRIKVILEAIPKEVSHQNYDLIYLFRGGYSSSNVSITKGTFEKAEVRDSGYYLEVTLKMNSLVGTFDPPVTADWIEPIGTATWGANELDSGFHDIICMRGSTTVKKLNYYRGTEYNFYPYMTKSGDYKFKIRTVSDPSVKGAKSSEWLESGDLYIDETMVSDGSGQTSADEDGGGQAGSTISSAQYPTGTGMSEVVGWIEQNGYTYFFYPNGEYAKSGWVRLDGKWYMFDEHGHRLTGWQKNKYGYWYYLDPQTAVMRTGWLHDKDNWYYLDTTEGDLEGRMIVGWLKWNNEYYYFNSSGAMVTGWYKVDNIYRYFYPEGSTGGAYGYMARNTSIGDFTFDENGVWK